MIFTILACLTTFSTLLWLGTVWQPHSPFASMVAGTLATVIGLAATFIVLVKRRKL